MVHSSKLQPIVVEMKQHLEVEAAEHTAFSQETEMNVHPQLLCPVLSFILRHLLIITQECLLLVTDSVLQHY